jgi:hypothetical protein
MVRALERRITFGANQRGGNHPARGRSSIRIKNQQPRQQRAKTEVKHV